MLLALLLAAGSTNLVQEQSFFVKYRACLKREAIKLDDRRSDVDTIFDAARSECVALRTAMLGQIFESIRAKQPKWPTSRALKVADSAADQIDARVRPEILKEILISRRHRN